MSIYAKNTSVSVEKSRAEIEAILTRYGASAFAYATNEDKAMIQFQANDRRIRFVLQIPNKKDRAFTHRKRGGTEWTDELAYKLWEKACRQLWRALALSIKARLETAASGIDSFEDVFMSHIILPDGKTVGEHMQPQIESAYKNGKMPALLPHFGK